MINVNYKYPTTIFKMSKAAATTDMGSRLFDSVQATFDTKITAWSVQQVKWTYEGKNPIERKFIEPDLLKHPSISESVSILERRVEKKT